MGFIKNLEEEKQLFKEAFLKASEQMNIVQQYYEYQWSDDDFGMTTGKVQTVDAELLRLIYEQIQELSDNGDAESATLIREFVEKELITGHIPSEVDFDVAFKNWKKDKLKLEVKQFSEFWGIQNLEIMIKSIYSYTESQSGVIPYIDEINQSVDFESALNKENENRLNHIIKLMEELPVWIRSIQSRLLN